MTVAVLGRREMGKTTFEMFLVRKFAKVVALDPRNQIPEGTDGVICDPEDVAEMLDDFHRIVVRPTGNLQAATLTLAYQVTEYLRLNPDAELAIVLDEAGTIKDALKQDSWNWLFRTVNRKRVWIIMSAHRPVDIDPTVRALLDLIIVFRTTHEADVEALKDRCGRAFAEQARRLPEKVALMWDDTQADERKQVRLFSNPNEWFIPLGKPTVIADNLPASEELGRGY